MSLSIPNFKPTDVTTGMVNDSNPRKTPEYEQTTDKVLKVLPFSSIKLMRVRIYVF